MARDGGRSRLRSWAASRRPALDPVSGGTPPGPPRSASTEGSRSAHVPAPDPSTAAAQFLYREARLLDDRRWTDWLDLWTPDGWFCAPISESVGVPRSAVAIEPGPANGLHWFDEPVSTLAMRVQKLESGLAWSEVPPSRTRRLVTNVEVLQGDTSDQLRVRSNVLIYRQRGTADATVLAGHRQDLLVSEGGGLRIRRRLLTLDVESLPSADLSVVF